MTADPTGLSPTARALLGDLTDWEQELDAQVAVALAGLPLFVREMLQAHGRCISDRMAADWQDQQDHKDASIEVSRAMPKTRSALYRDMHRVRYPWLYEEAPLVAGQGEQLELSLAYPTRGPA